MTRTRLPFVLALAFAASLVVPAAASAATLYRVTVTNVNRAQPLSPPVVAVHAVGAHVFVPGEAASPGLTLVAESGNPNVLVDELSAAPAVLDVEVGAGPLLPGQSSSVIVESRGRFVYLSVAGMLGSTNDAFYGLDGIFLNERPWTRDFGAPAWDAGSEFNSESCATVPGPPCGGGARDTDGAEGMVLAHNGIHGIGDLEPAVWDFGFPAARVTVERLNGGE